MVVIFIYDFGVIAEDFLYFNRCVITMYFCYMLFDGTGIKEVVCKMTREGCDCMANIDTRSS